MQWVEPVGLVLAAVAAEPRGEPQPRTVAGAAALAPALAAAVGLCRELVRQEVRVHRERPQQGLEPAVPHHLFDLKFRPTGVPESRPTASWPQSAMGRVMRRGHAHQCSFI